MPSDARRVWVNSFICRVHLHTIAFNEMCFVLQIPSSVFRHVRAVDSAAFFNWAVICVAEEVCMLAFCWRGRRILTTDSSAPVPCEDRAGLASHRHKAPQGKCVNVWNWDWHGYKLPKLSAQSQQHPPDPLNEGRNSKPWRDAFAVLLA